MKLRSLLAVVAISALTLATMVPANAQGGAGGGQGGGRQGGRGRGGFGPQTPWSLVNRADVQKDIKITDDEKAKLDAARQDMMTKMQEMRQNGSGNSDPAAMRAQMTKMQDDMTATIKGIITPEQASRLVEIYIQLNGASSITAPEVQTKLGLSADQIAKIKSLQEAQTKANGEIRAKVQSGEVDRSQVRELMQKNTEIMKTELEKVLTEEQKAKLKTAGGAPFTADPAPAGGGFGGGGGGR